MSSTKTTPPPTTAEPVAAKPTAVQVSPITGKKICCACPETKRPRDECVIKFGEENCSELIEAHKACLRSQGFKI